MSDGGTIGGVLYYSWYFETVPSDEYRGDLNSAESGQSIVRVDIGQEMKGGLNNISIASFI